jgi:outer membrane protein OmpA-like peptidoglycan-associated protein
MTGKRFACLILGLAVVALGCANGRPKPVTCAVIGGLAGGGAGWAIGDEYHRSTEGDAVAAGAASGAVVFGVAGYYLCKAMQAEEAPPAPPPPAPTPPPVVEEVVAEKIVLRGVNFDFDKSEIRPDAAVILDEVVSILSGAPDTQVRIEGHTCSMGPDAYNQGLSERRAASVLKYLVEHGIATSRLSSAGFGESSPMATNDTREGRALNRRVELQVLE